VVITGWADGRIAWPRCRALGHRGGSGLLVEEELARAIQHESAAALCYWWGITCSTVTLWRKARAAAPRVLPRRQHGHGGTGAANGVVSREGFT
jgi:hypothetical protein